MKRTARRESAGGFCNTGGANALFVDGSVRFLRQSITIGTLAAAVSRNGGEAGPNLD